MKRLFTLIALLGLLGVFAGCNQGSTPPAPEGGTNTPPASTNK
jgi:hypothetical protein